MSGLSSSRITLSNHLENNQLVSPSKTGWVYEVILDENNEYSKSKNYGSSLVGSIRFRTSEMQDIEEKNLPVAYPFDKNFINLPVRNELVEIYEFDHGAYCYRRIGVVQNPTVSASEDAISTYFKKEKDSKQTTSDYNKVATTGITKSNKNDSNNYDGYGSYYTNQKNIHRIKLYEGDSLLETRFGQSIRFSGFNNTKNQFSPTIIIRNGQSSKYNDLDISKSIEEDVNTDGSTIAITSGQYQLPFLPGTVDDKNKSNFETKPDSFGDYPTKLIGDQILLNSGRIILSAKESEMIFYSKKNYGFISDGALSIDNKLGIDISVGDNINIVTNDTDVNIVSGKGSIFLGSDSLEPMVKGQQLVDALSSLIDAISQMQFLTPSGPSAIGPLNTADFGKIKSSLNSILSQLNQTA